MFRCAACTVLAASLASCTANQARVAKRAGEVTTAAALIGLLGTVVAAETWRDEHEELLAGGLVFVPISLVGAGVYIACDAMLNTAETTAPPPEHTSTWNAAMDLAKEAKHAARGGDCAEVQAIEPRVRELDSDVYLRFANDAVIRTCLGPH
ncbi:MAG TPA: hypothetical protein VMJ10_07005 [Kofleriaceae bacterium]|nr:hypothetical protein [Kofleriaceae bacterium]